MCGKLKRELGDSYQEDQITPRDARDVNMPKFRKDDLPLFENIMTDFTLHMVVRPQEDQGAVNDSGQQLNVLALPSVGLLPLRVHPDRGQDPFSGGDCQIAYAFDPSLLLYFGVEHWRHM
eukprot:2611638-Amphidinium_carterae.2